MPKSITSGQLDRLRREADRTKLARIYASTRGSYGTQVQQFVRFCDAVRRDVQFDDYELVTLFFQFYIAGFEGNCKLRAHTALPKFLSAWKDFAIDNDLEFPFPGTPLRRRINRFILGIKNRYPHVAKQDVPLFLCDLKLVAADLGITELNDLWTCDLAVLSKWARLIVAHDACMRPTEHSLGCRVSDVTDHGGFLTILVGSRVGESKRKNLPRLAVLFASPTHLSAGFVLRVVFSRIHGRRAQPATSLAAIGRATSTGELNHWRPVPAARQPVPAQPTTVSDPVLFPKCFGDDQLAAESLHSLRTQLIGCTEKLGITGIDTLNCLRAGGASDYFARGLPRWWVCRQGGWSPRSTTVDIYNRPTPFQRAAVAEVYNKSVVTVAGGDDKAGQPNGQVE